MRVHDLVRQEFLNGVLVSEDAHDNVRACLRNLHLMAAVVRRPVEDVGVDQEDVGKWYCLAHVVRVRCQLIVPSHFF